MNPSMMTMTSKTDKIATESSSSSDDSDEEDSINKKDKKTKESEEEKSKTDNEINIGKYSPHVEFKKVCKIRLAFLRNMKIRKGGNSTKQGEIIIHELSTEVTPFETVDPTEANLIRIKMPNMKSVAYNHQQTVLTIHKRRH